MASHLSSSRPKDLETDFSDEDDASFDQALAQISDTEWTRICSVADKSKESIITTVPPAFNLEKENNSPIDLTSSPEVSMSVRRPVEPKRNRTIDNLSNKSRSFGKDLTNLTLLEKIDQICTSKFAQNRSFATVSSIYPPLPDQSNTKAAPLPTTSSTIPKPDDNSNHRSLALDKSFPTSRTLTAREKEWELQRLEKDLVGYTYKRPAGKIGIMRKTNDEIESERADLQLSIFQGRANAPKIAICPVHVPQLYICTSVKQSEDCLKKIQSGEVLSFDMEWEYNRVTGYQHRTSVIQLASATDIYILQVSLMPFIPNQLIRILADPTILKCGVSIKHDATKFRGDFDYQVNGLIELSHLAKKVNPEKHSNDRSSLISLRNLCRIYLNRKLNKDSSIRGSDWSKGLLNEEQYHYAANDAYVGLEIIHSLAGLIIQSDPLREARIFDNEEVRKILVEIESGKVKKTKKDILKDKENDKKSDSSISVKNTKLFPIKASTWNSTENDYDFEAIAEEYAFVGGQKKAGLAAATTKTKRTRASPSSSPKAIKKVSTKVKEKSKVNLSFKDPIEEFIESASEYSFEEKGIAIASKSIPLKKKSSSSSKDTKIVSKSSTSKAITHSKAISTRSVAKNVKTVATTTSPSPNKLARSSTRTSLAKNKKVSSSSLSDTDSVASSSSSSSFSSPTRRKLMQLWLEGKSFDEISNEFNFSASRLSSAAYYIVSKLSEEKINLNENDKNRLRLLIDQDNFKSAKRINKPYLIRQGVLTQ